MTSASTLGLVQVGEIAVEGVARRFRVHGREARTLKDVFVQRGRTEATDVWALRDVSVEVAPGEAVGLIGRNGSGKTTLLRLIAGIIKPTAGRIRAEGRIGSLLELGAGFHRDFTGRENVFLNGAILGMRRQEIARKFDEIAAFAEVDDFLDTPLKRYSAGMRVRLASSMASATPFSGVIRPTKARYEPGPSLKGRRSRGRPWWIVAIQSASGDQRRWLSLLATRGMSVNSLRSSGMPLWSSRPCRVVSTGVGQRRAKRKPSVSTCEWMTSKRSCCCHTLASVRLMKLETLPV